MAKKRGQRPKAKKNSSTVLYADDFRKLVAECDEKGTTESERLREIVSAFYSNERLKTIGRDYVESPLRNLHQGVIIAEVAPLIDKMAILVKEVQNLRLLSEDILGSLPPVMQTATGTRELNAEQPEMDSSLVVAAAEMSSRAAEIVGYLEEIRNLHSASVGMREQALLDEIAEVKRITAVLGMKVIRTAVHEAARRELGSARSFAIEWSPEAGFTIHRVFKVAADVRDDEREISPADAMEHIGKQVNIGENVHIPISLEQLVAIANKSMGYLQDPDE
jgi:hypothetical protein